ncbi:MAG: hypothetical protein M3130_08635 [Actinomycetota bacterium]|nr:hypothetical protein [Actinomycetota bacterium]
MVPADQEADLAAATTELYGLDPATFVAARNEVVCRLRKQGDRALATLVAALRRPTPAAWAVNQLARQHPRALDDLIRLGDALRRAQSDLLAGGDAADLRNAGRDRRKAVSRLTASAIALLDERGPGSVAHHAEIAATLEAASLDPEAAVEVASGRLTSGLEAPSGFGEPGDGTLGETVQEIAEISPPLVADKAHPAGPAEAATDAAERTRVLAEAEHAVGDAETAAADLLAAARDAKALAARCRADAAETDAQVRRVQRQLDDARGRAAAERRGADRTQKAAEAADEEAAAAVDRRRQASRRLKELRSRS